MISLSGLITLIIALVVLGVVVWLTKYIVATVPIGDPLGRVIVVVVTVICCLYALILLLQFAGIISGIGPVVVRP